MLVFQIASLFGHLAGHFVQGSPGRCLGLSWQTRSGQRKCGGDYRYLGTPFRLAAAGFLIRSISRLLRARNFRSARIAATISAADPGNRISTGWSVLTLASATAFELVCCQNPACPTQVGASVNPGREIENSNKLNHKGNIQ